MQNNTTIYFKYGCMNSGKSLDLIKVAHNYEENGVRVLILKPKVDSREKNKVSSRVGLTKDAIEIKTVDDVLALGEDFKNDTSVVLVDEAQFLNPVVIGLIQGYCYDNHIHTLMFFGLKTDFKGELFEGSKKIIEIADKIEESTSICWCGKKARQNARVINGHMTKDGPIISVEDDQSDVEYVSLCNYHYFEGELK